MIVFYSNPNTLTLPYIDSNSQSKFFKFLPGKNHMSETIWLAVVKAAGKNIGYYETVLSVFQPRKSIEIEIPKNEDGEEVMEIEVGKDEQEIKYSNLNVRDMSELIENTMDGEELKDYMKMEKNRAKSRVTIMRLLEEKIAQISEIEEVLKKKED